MPDHDVIVAGGGPAGSCVAALVAEAGRRVLLVERSPEPRFKVGESLMPATYWTLDRLGVLEEMKASPFPEKRSVQFISEEGRASRPFYFHESDPHESSRTWQVLRRDFDRMLLDNARRKGAEVRTGCSVTDVLFEGERAVGVRLRCGDREREMGARVVVDATGQSALLSRTLGLQQIYEGLRNVSYYAHFEGARRDEGIDEGATLVFHTRGRRSWFWFIPLPGDLASVGVVGAADTLLRSRPGGPQEVFEEELARCPALRERLAAARQARDVRVARDFSYRSRRLAGDGWVLVGDAYGFLDPIYSTGVFLALKSGELAADAILAALEAGDVSGERLGRFEEEYRSGMESLLDLVHAFYHPDFSFSAFLEEHPELRGEIIDLLMGNVFRRPPEGLAGPLREVCRLRDRRRRVEA